jgi:hypothetical protein
MADEMNEDEKLDEGYTEFPSLSAGKSNAYFYPSGKLGQFLAKFFATKALPHIADKEGQENPLAGDTVVSKDIIKPSEPGKLSVSRSGPILPEVELSRRKRYKDYEEMDDYPEIGAAFDIYADDCTQKNTRGKRWNIKTNNQDIADEAEDLFQTINFDRFYWDIARNTIKYGDCFIELIMDTNNFSKGVQRIKVLNPNFILRVENEFGYLTDFLQKIPDKNEFDTFQMEIGQANHKKSSYISLDKNQIVHFRLHTSDPAFYPYGKSIAHSCHRIYRSLRMMEDAMLIYRLARAPERRIFYVDVGNLPAAKAEAFIERLKDKFKKERFFNTQKGTIDGRFNPLSADEDFFVPMRGNSGTKIETLKGAENLGEVDDVKYFRDKLLAALKVPKDYIVEKDQSPERKANLSQLDVKFARTIQRIQHSVEIGIEVMLKRHFQIRGYPESDIKSLRVELPEPTDMFAKRLLDLEEQKTRVIQAVVGTGLFPTERIYKDYYDMTDREIDELKTKLEEEQKAQAEKEQDAAGATGAAAGAPMAADQGAPMDGAENAAPTTNEEVINILSSIRSKYLGPEFDYDKQRTVQRIIEKQQDREEEL